MYIDVHVCYFLVRIIGNNRRESEEMKKIRDVLRGLKREREEKEHQLRKRQQRWVSTFSNIIFTYSKQVYKMWFVPCTQYDHINSPSPYFKQVFSDILRQFAHAKADPEKVF